jgi:hypothetical protein
MQRVKNCFMGLPPMVEQAGAACGCGSMSRRSISQTPNLTIRVLSPEFRWPLRGHNELSKILTEPTIHEAPEPTRIAVGCLP